jgi:hypothetical protein
MTARNVRAFTNRDADRSVEILSRNERHDDQDANGLEAMCLLAEYDEAAFLDRSHTFNRSIEV